MKSQEKETVTDVKSFVVDRSTWYRGKGHDNSCLLNKSNKMCCLGFYALACGIDKSIIRDIACPSEAVLLTKDETAINRFEKDVKRKSDKLWKTKLVRANNNSATCCALMTVNDNEGITDEKRESRITRLFKKIGIEVKFK